MSERLLYRCNQCGKESDSGSWIILTSAQSWGFDPIINQSTVHFDDVSCLTDWLLRREWRQGSFLSLSPKRLQELGLDVLIP